MSPRHTLETSPRPSVHIPRAEGDLVIKGWAQTEIVCKTDSETPPFQVDGETVTLSLEGDATLYLPYESTLHLESCAGDLRIKAIQGSVEVAACNGSLDVRDGGALHVAGVQGDFSARRMRADLRLETIGGDALVKDVDGQFAAQAIGGDLRLRDVNGGISVVTGGDANVRFAPVPWQAYRIEAGGDILCRLPEDASANLELHSGKREIRLRLAKGSETLSKEHHELVLGEAQVAPSVYLQAGRRLIVRQDPESETIPLGKMPGDLASQIESQVLAQLDLAEAQLDAQLSDLAAQLGGTPLPDEIRRRTQEHLQQARQRIRHKMVHLQGARQRAAEPHEPVSEEERLMILRMLQDGKITSEEAERLLAALEGEAA